MIKTKYKIDLTIDELAYNLEYVTPSKDKALEFKKEYENTTKIIEDIQNKENEINFIEEENKINKELLELLSGDERRKALLEQKKILQKIKKLKAELSEMNNQEIDLNDLAKKRFAISVMGEDKEKLMTVIAEKNVGYFELMNVIDEQLQREKEKK